MKGRAFVMKKVITLLLLSTFIFTLTGCAFQVYKLPNTQFCTSAVDGSIVALEKVEKEFIINLLNYGTWQNDIAKCPADYEFHTEHQFIGYCAEDGVFNDFTLSRSLHISDKNKDIVNSYLDYDGTKGSFHAKNLDCSFSRARGSVDTSIYAGALNVEELSSNAIKHLPIYKFDTLADLEQFKTDFGGEEGFIYGYNEVPSFNEVTEKYDDEFFDTNTLFLVYIDTYSSSLRFGVDSLHADGSNLIVNVAQINHPQIMDDAMASWFITVAVSDNMIKEYTYFDARLVLE